VTVLAEELRPAYDRVALWSYVDGTSAEELTLPELDPLVDLRLGEPAVAVDRSARTVRTAAGQVLRYGAPTPYMPRLLPR
jgi:nitrite reductase (NADH) large subunit